MGFFIEEINKYEYIEIDGIMYATMNSKYEHYIKEKKYNYLLSISGIPEEYKTLNFSNYKGELSLQNVEKCIKYSTECNTEKFKNINLYLSGSYGTQKTTLACSIGKGFIANDYKVKFIYASELIDYLMKNQGFSENNELQKKIDSYMSCDLLIIDDFGKGTYWKNNPDLIIEAWDKFLRRLISENKRILMTSNYSLSYIKEHYGESLYMLLHRNFEELIFYDSIHEVSREKFEGLWD